MCGPLVLCLAPRLCSSFWASLLFDDGRRRGDFGIFFFRYDRGVRCSGSIGIFFSSGGRYRGNFGRFGRGMRCCGACGFFFFVGGRLCGDLQCSCDF